MRAKFGSILGADVTDEICEYHSVRRESSVREYRKLPTTVTVRERRCTLEAPDGTCCRLCRACACVQSCALKACSARYFDGVRANSRSLVAAKKLVQELASLPGNAYSLTWTGFSYVRDRTPCSSRLMWGIVGCSQNAELSRTPLHARIQEKTLQHQVSGGQKKLRAVVCKAHEKFCLHFDINNARL